MSWNVRVENLGNSLRSIPTQPVALASTVSLGKEKAWKSFTYFQLLECNMLSVRFCPGKQWLKWVWANNKGKSHQSCRHHFAKDKNNSCKYFIVKRPLKIFRNSVYSHSDHYMHIFVIIKNVESSLSSPTCVKSAAFFSRPWTLVKSLNK